jgi:hypothetical protein
MTTEPVTVATIMRGQHSVLQPQVLIGSSVLAVAALLVLLFTPLPRILEQLDPGGGALGVQPKVLGVPMDERKGRQPMTDSTA